MRLLQSFFVAMILAGVWLLAYSFAGAFERWITAYMDPRKQGRLSKADFVREPDAVLWRRALDRAMSAQLIGNADQFPRHLRCPFCPLSHVTEYEVREMNDPQPLLSLAHHLAMTHAERLTGINAHGDSLAVKA